MTASPQPTTLPKGSLILVTGATGYIAAHIVQQFLERGYKVRGTVRSLAKAQWLSKELFAKEASKGDFELVEVPDMSVDGAYDKAMPGVSAVVHVATISTLSPDPNEVIPQTIAGTVNALHAAAKEPSVKRFVYTSTIAASAMPVPNTPFHVEEDTWNEAAVPLAWAPPPYEPSRGLPTYAASKVEAEKAVWKFAKEEKPSFVVNAVLPFTTFGPLLHEKQNASTAALLFSLFEGQVNAHMVMPAMKYIHVGDVALMHVAAVLDPDVSNRRIHTWSDGFNWNIILAMFRKNYPDKKFIDNLEGMDGTMMGTVDDSLGRELLKKWDGGRGEWKGLEEGVQETLAGKKPAALTGAFS